MADHYDVFVVGTGTAGYTLAHACRKAGLTVAIADSRPYGGTCAMRGCQPKKYLVAAAEVAALSKQMSDIGVSPVAYVDWFCLQESRERFTSAVPGKTEKSFADAGIDTYYGTVRFVTPEKVSVDDAAIITADRFVIASGSTPVPLHFSGAEYVATSDDFLELPSLPRRIIFIGGGYVSLEFAHIAKAAGADAIILQRGSRILKSFEEEVVEQLHQSAKDFGIRIVTDFEACEVKKKKNSFTVFGKPGCTDTYDCDLVCHGAGRKAAVDLLDLAQGKVSYSGQGVEVNEYLQSVSNERVYAIGDVVAGSARLATIADMEAEVAAENIVHGNRRKPDYEGVPTVVFSIPPIAGVGMREEDAQAANISYRVNSGTMTGWASSRRIGQDHAYYKVLLEQETGKILGAHILGHDAGETINIFAMAVKFGLTAADLRKVLWAYPTSVSDLKYTIG